MSLKLVPYAAILALVLACGGDGGPTAPPPPPPPAPVGNDFDDDGIPNVVDACPNVAEIFNNYRDVDGCPDDSLELYTGVRVDAEVFWNQIFALLGLQYTFITGFTPYSGPVAYACGHTDLFNALYCPSDGSVWYHREFLDFVLLAGGDGAAAVIIAHEIGHHISNLDGVFVLLALGLVTGKQVELQADCYAGAWGAWVANRGLLEAGDLEEAANLLLIIGDDNLGQPWFNPNGHGTSAQRLTAFAAGFLFGVAGCVDISIFPAASVADLNPDGIERSLGDPRLNIP